jgi:prephenate dehydrogenase
MIRQITIIGTGLIGGSLGLALRKNKFKGKLIGCDRPEVLRRAKRMRAIDVGTTDPLRSCKNSDLIVLATPVAGIIELIEKIAPHVGDGALVTDVGGTKSEILAHAQRAFGSPASRNFLAGHPMAGKEHSGIEFADPDLFRGAVWFLTPLPGQTIKTGIAGDYVSWLQKIGAKISVLDSAEHDELCAWISHVPQMISTALAASLVDEYGENAPLLESGGRALREMTRIAASPYPMWRDVALTNKKTIADALLKMEQRLAHIRENLGTRELQEEFATAHKLRKVDSSRRRGSAEKSTNARPQNRARS